MDMPCLPAADRLLQVRLGFEPSPSDLFMVLQRASGELRSREDATDVLVDATWCGKVAGQLDAEFLSWIVIHYDRLRMFAVVVDDVGACEARVQRLAWVSGKPIAVFAREDAAREWLHGHPWPSEAP